MGLEKRGGRNFRWEFVTIIDLLHRSQQPYEWLHNIDNKKNIVKIDKINYWSKILTQNIWEFVSCLQKY